MPPAHPTDGGPAGRADRLAHLAAILRDAVLRGDGVTDPAMRRAAAGEAGAEAGAGAAPELPEPVAAFVAMVRDDSYRVSDATVERLLTSGWSEDAVFELTIAAALGAADRGLAAGLDAVSRQREG
jgi:hypothetical protein